MEREIAPRVGFHVGGGGLQPVDTEMAAAKWSLGTSLLGGSSQWVDSSWVQVEPISPRDTTDTTYLGLAVVRHQVDQATDTSKKPPSPRRSDRALRC